VKNVRALYFAARGWILAGAFLLLVWSRATSDAPLRPQMLALVASGMLLRAWAGAHLGPHGNAGKAEAPDLARTGPYAFSRNPLYLSNMAMGAGLVLFANSLSPLLAAIMLVFLFAHHLLLALWEEKYLRRAWPGQYALYAQSVPRWFGVRRPEESAEEPSTSRETGTIRVRQGRNLAYASVCVLILWIASRF
jgi:protein-S-isoprenylcysteine O-methyltransferase Ste14